MSAATVAELLADLIGPAANANPEPTPAKAANPAKTRASIGAVPDSGACEGLRIPAKPASEPATPSRDSQVFAGIRNPSNPATSEQPCGSSQLSQDSQGSEPATASRTCRDCAQRTRNGTCRKPIKAGLLPEGEPFGIVWAPQGHAATCSGFEAKAHARAPDRPYRLSKAEADAAHAEPWDEAACARFVARVGLFLRRGIDATDADDLAERLHLRDLQGDDCRQCVECAHLTGRAGAWRCGNARAAGIARELPADLVTLPQRCMGFAP